MTDAGSARRNAILFWACLAFAVLASRLAHANILWADEDYHLAAAIQVLYGKLPYRDFWYDKPPLNVLFYLLFGARTGLPLRSADALFVCLCCALAYRFASQLWSRQEGLVAAAALAFFQIFYLAPAVLPLEPDTLMLAPHLAAVYLAWRGRPFLAGLAAGVAFQLSVKGLFVLASAALFATSGWLALMAGFVVPAALVLGSLALAGAAPAYFDQVWRWGWLYTGGPEDLQPLRVVNWFGFHAALLLGAVLYWIRERAPERLRFAFWCAFSFGAAVAGSRLAPRYFNALLPALAIPAARGFTKASRPLQVIALLALIVPAVRFGPTYIRPDTSKDVAMDRESRDASRIIQAFAAPGDTVFIWGYRPDVIAYARLPVAGRFWDSQPLTGVPADRHLFDARPISEAWARENRQELLRMQPAFLVDGLSLYNPRLRIQSYPELAAWLAQYCPIGRAGGTVVYRRCGL